MGLARYLYSSFIFAIVLGASLGSAALGDAQNGAVPAPAPSQSPDDDFIHIPPQDDCLAKAGSWSEPEKWAWQQICSRERIDFNKRYGKPKKNSDDLANDRRRVLSPQFLRQIFEDPRFQPYTQTAAVNIEGAFLPSVQIGNTSVGYLSIVNSTIGGDIDLTSITILRSIVISGSKVVGDVNLRLIQGGNMSFASSTLGNVQVQQLNISRLSFVSGRLTSLGVRISRFSQQLAILYGATEKIVLDDVKSDGLFVEPGSAKSIDINDYVDTGMFFLSVAKWLPKSELQLKTLTTGRFLLRKSLPEKILTSSFSFSGADWGPDPLPQLKRWTDVSSEYVPSLYTNLAGAYRNDGQSETASDILIAKQNADYTYATSALEKTYLFVTWILADYGYHPEIGLLWIVGFVGIATLVFKTGEKLLASGTRPRNWLVFAFDSVIPGVQLDDQHKDVGFSGWRQYFLYCLRFLSAVVIVLVIELLKKSLSGLG